MSTRKTPLSPREQRLNARLDRVISEREDLRQVEQELRTRLETVTEAHARLGMSSSQLQGQLKVAEDQRDELDRKLSCSEGNVTFWRGRAEKSEKWAQGLQQKVMGLESEASQLEDRLRCQHQQDNARSVELHRAQVENIRLRKALVEFGLLLAAAREGQAVHPPIPGASS